MVLVSAPIGPLLVYDSDMVYIIFITIGSFIVYENYADKHDVDFIYLGGMWTGNSNQPYCQEVKFSWRRKQFLGKNKESELWIGVK